MEEFLNHATHNKDFHTRIEDLYSGHYFDWKIVCLFYTSIHYLKALACKRNKNIGDNHREIIRNITHGTMQISGTARTNYVALFNYSQIARYEGIDDMDSFNLLRENDYRHAVKCFTDFEKFIHSSIA